MDRIHRRLLIADVVVGALVLVCAAGAAFCLLALIGGL